MTVVANMIRKLCYRYLWVLILAGGIAAFALVVAARHGTPERLLVSAHAHAESRTGDTPRTLKPNWFYPGEVDGDRDLVRSELRSSGSFDWDTFESESR